VSQARTLWEEGREPGYQVVALGLAVALTVVALDLARADRVTSLFDAVFVLVCVALALLVRPEDFFTVGVLPPLIMAAAFFLVGLTRPAAIAHPDDGVVQAVVSGLSTHAVALGVGYGLCLACLAVRRRFCS
jgi:heme/copper-type cytochrome/quinol oxidase subunit 4